MSSQDLPIYPIQLIKVNTKKINAEKYIEDIPDQKTKVSFENSIKLDNIDGKDFIIHLILSITTSPHKLFDINIEITGHCRVMTEETDYSIDEFSDQQGLGLLWPYARELVTNITQRFGFPALILPTLKIKAVKE